MKKFVLIGLILSVISLVSCNKETGPDCEVNNWGYLTVDSYFDDPYDVYIDGAYKGTVSAFGVVTYGNISSGTHATEYRQASGFLFTPDVYTLSINISDCNTETVTLQ